MKRIFSVSLGIGFAASLAFGCESTQGGEDGSLGESQESLTVDCSKATDWATGVAYAVGAVVRFSGNTYQCLQAHTSQPDWTPPAVPALWNPVTCSGGTGGGTDAGTDSGARDSGSGSADAGTPPATGIPKHELTGYWQNFTNGATALRLRDVPANYDIIAVAFADANPSSPGGVTFNVDSGLSSAVGGYTNANFISDVQTVHANGKHVVLSIGGANGSLDLSSSGNVTNFVNSAAGLISQFGFDGIDIDLENGINVANLTSGLQQLQQRVGSRFLLTMAPQTIDVQPGGAYLQLINNVKSIISVVHTQYYNSGTMLGRDQKVYAEGTEDFETALADLLLETLRPDQVALGLPASSSAAGGGVVAPSVVNAALDCLARGTNCGSYKPVALYPTIRGAMTWSINWDLSNGSNFANTIKPHLNGLP